jgi:hypothetical protein
LLENSREGCRFSEVKVPGSVIGEYTMAHFEEDDLTPVTTRDLQQNEPCFVIVWGRGPNYEPLYVIPQKSGVLDTDTVASRDTDVDPLRVRWKIWAGEQTGPIELVAKRPNGIDEAKMILNIKAVSNPKLNFVLKLVREGGETSRLWGLPVSLMLAQACLESNKQQRYSKQHIIWYRKPRRI